MVVSELKPHLAYMYAILKLLPEALQPEDGEKSGWLNIRYFDPTEDREIRISRNIASYLDGSKGIQDLVAIGGQVGAELNFHIDPAGNIDRFPEHERLLEVMAKFALIIEEWKLMAGSTIYCARKLRYRSDGTNWVEVAPSNYLPQQSLMIEAEQSEDETQLALQSPYVAYHNTIMDLLPEALTPEGNQNGSGMRLITFNGANEQVRIYRSISRYIDGNIGIQDEIYINNSNVGVQLNFELDGSGNLVQFPTQEKMSDLMISIIGQIRELSTQEGATIYCRYDCRYKSDGANWVEVQPSVQSKKKEPKPLRLEDGKDGGA